MGLISHLLTEIHENIYSLKKSLNQNVSTDMVDP